MELSKEAKRALVNAAPREGARVDGTSGVLSELLERNLTTRFGFLTRKGTIARARILDEMLEAM